MAEPSESDPNSKEEKKFKIRPRQMDEGNEEVDEEKLDDEESFDGPKRKIWTGKTPFPKKVRDGAGQDSADEELGIGPKQPEAGDNRYRKERKRKKAALWEEWRGKVLVFLKTLPQREVSLIPFAIGALIVLVLFSWIFNRSGFARGRAEGLREAEEAATRVKVELPPEVAEELNNALLTLRQGNAAEALKVLQRLEERRKDYASMSYLVALAAMQNGDIALAERKVLETIAKRERVSDALALQSVLETQKAADRSLAIMGDPKVRSEALLRQAVVADAANPYPHFELATLLRYKGQREEAVAEIKAAQARLNPMDSHLVMDVTLSLINLEMKPDMVSSVPSLESDDARKLLPGAYMAMTRGQFGLAAAILQKCRGLLAPDVFDYLVNDPAFRRFAREKELRKFYGN